MKSIEEIKAIIGIGRATKTNIVSSLLKKGQISPYEASILLEGSLTIHIDSINIDVSSGSKIIIGDDLVSE